MNEQSKGWMNGLGCGWLSGYGENERTEVYLRGDDRILN